MFSVSVIGGAMVIHAVVFNSMSLLAMSSTLLAVWTVQSCLNRPLRWLFLGFFTAGSGLAAGLASVAASPRRDPLEHVILVGTVLLAVAVVALAGANRRAANSRTERALERVALLEAQQDALHRLPPRRSGRGSRENSTTSSDTPSRSSRSRQKALF